MEKDLVTLSQRFWASCTSIFEKRRYRSPMVALCKALAKSTGIGLFITAVCKNARKKTLGQDDFFVVRYEIYYSPNNCQMNHKSYDFYLHELLILRE